MNTPTPRPGWIAQVQGHGFDLAYWEQSLKPPFDPVPSFDPPIAI
jgi:hypothetical protein